MPRPAELPRDVSPHSKDSLPSSSQSNEADDEQSSSEHTDMDDDPAPPLYAGEDTRLTSDKELSGFYMYGWAAEVCAVSSLVATSTAGAIANGVSRSSLSAEWVPTDLSPRMCRCG